MHTKPRTRMSAASFVVWTGGNNADVRQVANGKRRCGLLPQLVQQREGAWRSLTLPRGRTPRTCPREAGPREPRTGSSQIHKRPGEAHPRLEATSLVAQGWGLGSVLLFDALFSGMHGTGYEQGLAQGFEQGLAQGSDASLEQGFDAGPDGTAEGLDGSWDFGGGDFGDFGDFGGF